MTYKIPEIYQGQDVAHCGKCKRWKPKQNFHKNSKNKTGVHGICKVCQKEWRDKNKQKLIQSAIKWQKENPEKAIANIRRWEKSNPEKAKEYKDASNKKQNERIKNDPELLNIRRAQKNEFAKKKQKLFPEISQAKYSKRRARILDSEGSFTPDEWTALCEKYGNICLCCKEKKPLTIDHVIPLSKGGKNSIDNIQPLCLECNMYKHTKTIDYR